MADFDVGAVALIVPPASAVITPYRPAVSVRNNGIHAALAVGTLRIYSAGSVIFTSDIFSATIPAGETGTATAVKYWTPPATGQYMVIAYVSCTSDQYEPNNSLAPTTFTVTDRPPPEPLPVTEHAAQHEEGGGDELSIDGLRGKAKDRQDPYSHASDHETGGGDELSVDGLSGTLATPQPTEPHANEKHTAVFQTASDVASSIGVHNSLATAHEAGITGIVTGAVTTHDADELAHPGIGFKQGLIYTGVTVKPAETKTQFLWTLPGFEAEPVPLAAPAAFKIEGMCYVTYNNAATTVTLDLLAQGASKAKLILPLPLAPSRVYYIMYEAMLMPFTSEPPLELNLYSVVMFRATFYRETSVGTGDVCTVHGCATREVEFAAAEDELQISITAALASLDGGARIQAGRTIGYRLARAAETS